jgi:heme A synthase
MGCSTDWPFCYGQVGPIDHFHTLLEQVHRYLATVVSAGVVAVALQAWRLRPSRAFRPALSAVVIVAVEIVLGAVTVVTHNAPVTVALHLAVALLLLAATTVTAMASWGASRPSAHEPRRPALLASSAVVATFVLLVSGSIVVDGNASAACATWPWCSPHRGVTDRLVAIVLVHRGVAFVAVGLLVALAVVALLRRQGRAPGAVALAWSLLGLCAAEVAAGAVTAELSAPPAAQEVHLGLAAAIWVCVVAFVAALSYSGGPVEVASGHSGAPVREPAGVGLDAGGSRGAAGSFSTAGAGHRRREAGSLGRRRLVSSSRLGGKTVDLRRVGFASVIALLVQFVLGVAASLWVTLGTKEPWSHIGNVALFSIHGVIGVAIALMSFVVVGLAWEEGPRTTKTWAAVALFGVLAALGCGFGFVESGGASGYSFGMALGWALALFANVCLALGRLRPMTDISPGRAQFKNGS